MNWGAGCRLARKTWPRCSPKPTPRGGSPAGTRRKSPTGIPYLAPEVQLFYKTKATRAKDETDFEAVLPLLDESQRVWLADSIAATAPDHPWRKRLLSAART